MQKVRVLIVDDSIFMRTLISDLLTDSGVIEVIGTASNGLEAVDKIKSLSPDVVTLDVEMPKLNGLEVLKMVMSNTPVPIIMLSSLTKQGTDTTIKALHYGAFDFIAKPSGSISLDIKKISNEIIDKILIANTQKDKWIKQWNRKSNTTPSKTIDLDEFENLKKLAGDQKTLHGIVAIGTSTGGPKALQKVLTNIPKNFPYALLVVQHMPPGFTKSLATRLDSLSEIKVFEAEDMQSIEPGTAYIAPGDYHMTVTKNANKYHISLNKGQHIGRHRPAVDVLFKSLAGIDLEKIFVIMTGMGSDGTEGIKAAKTKDSDIIIAEAEESCIVFGMPKSAIQTGLVDFVVPLDNIANYIIKGVNKQRRWP
ncbi:chemotaxis response regulator protein-glutamate methylesterase [Vulcanibacillus modesticaldus]|uniref:Protein-glutamate methylesterase/protein-glutamine glutaminase n=1 Tax=Vulcanibacillus modesticaldus TaxID=337097 RepID=A0A1D2YXM1_9BACI|nr:chemotaxis response regulator protein-glutamate methylesterase [Vulcanibacillus modesticaldus]OEG00420.1 chemotaxis response regulator protein-glutamate methylesterase [Vulcanibacillus modesticaldus]